MYRIDLTTILRVLFHQSGELHASLNRLPSGAKEPCQIKILFAEGKVLACSVESKNGVILEGSDALRFIMELGILEWEYIPQLLSAPPALIQPPTESSSERQSHQIQQVLHILPTSLPVRTRLVRQQEFLSWPRTYRSVYNMIDGNKSVTDIALLLSQSPERVIDILSELLEKRIITMTAYPQKN